MNFCFELTAVGFLGLGFPAVQRKTNGAYPRPRVLPVGKTAFIASKLGLFLLSDLVFATLLTVINLGIPVGCPCCRTFLLQTGILSMFMALAGFFARCCCPVSGNFLYCILFWRFSLQLPYFLRDRRGLPGIDKVSPHVSLCCYGK